MATSEETGGILRAARRMERLTAVTTHPGESLGRLGMKRTRVLGECIVRELLALPYRRRALAPLRRSRMTKVQQQALVLGNGPSVARLDPEAVVRAQAGGLELIVVNWFPLSSLGSTLVPDILVLSDPTMRPGSDVDPRNRDLWGYIHSHERLRLVVPVSWFRVVHRVEALAGRVWFFDDASLEGWVSSTSPMRPRGYLSMTAYKALGVALYLGYQDIRILGIDNTMFLGLQVDEYNQIVLKDRHFYGKARDDQGISWFCPQGVADYFYDLSLCFLHLRRCFGRTDKIINLDPASLVDCFPKERGSELLARLL